MELEEYSRLPLLIVFTVYGSVLYQRILAACPMRIIRLVAFPLVILSVEMGLDI